MVSFALLGWKNFDADQAFGGLMTSHWLRGEYAVYPWGQRYFGTAIVWFMSWAMRIFGPENIMSVRAAQMFLYLVLVILTARVVQNIWGRASAIVTVCVLSFPGPYLMNFLIIHTFPSYAVVATICLFLALYHGKTHLSRWFVMGILMGVGYWQSPSFLEYIFAILCMLLISSEEWGSLWQKLEESFGLGCKTITFVTVCGLGIVSVLCFLLQGNSEVVTKIGASMFVALCCGLLVCLLLVSVRRVRILSAWTIGIIGWIVGVTPVWFSWFIQGLKPESRLQYVLPLPRHIAAMTHSLLPSFWGVTPLTQWSVADYGIFSIILYSFTLICCSGLVIIWLWINRNLWIRLCSGKRISFAERATVFVLLIFFIPIVSVAMRFPANEGQVRYLLEAWPAWGMMLGSLFAAHLLPYRRLVAAALTCVCVTSASLSLSYWISKNSVTDGPLAPSYVLKLEEYLEQHDIRGGYANYWAMYPINFLTEERLIFAPYFGSDRYQPFNQFVHSQKRFAFIISSQSFSPYPQAIETALLPLRINTEEEFLQGVLQSGIVQTHYAHVIERLHRAHILDRKQIGGWDIWLLEDSI